MATIYRQRHPQSTVLYRVLATCFDGFLAQYEARFQRRYGYFRPVVREVVERYLDCANPMCGFARIRCPECEEEYLVTFSCKTRHFCPSCHARRREAWSIWLIEHLLLRVPHRQVVLTIPKMLRPFFRYRRALLSDLCLCAVRAIGKYMEACADRDLMPGVIAVIQTFGNRLNFHPHLHMLVTEGGRTSDGSFHPVPIFDDAALARLFAHEVLAFLVSGDLVSPEITTKILSWRHTGFNTHSKVKTTTREQAQRVARYMAKPIVALGRLAFDHDLGKVIYRYGKEDSCPACGSEIKTVAFITNYEVIDRIIHHLRLTFRCQRPPPPHQQEELY